MGLLFINGNSMCQAGMNGSLINEAYINGKQVVQGFCNVFEPVPVYEDMYLTFIAQESGTFKFSGSSSSNTLQYSFDSGSTWVTLADNTDTPTVQSGSSIMWKASGLTINGNNGIGSFSSSGMYEVEGNIMSLLYADNFQGQTDLTGKDFVLGKLFIGSTGLTSAENLVLPATTLSIQCYGDMFNGCTSLTTASELPATILTINCYINMFQLCTNLKYIKCLATDISAFGCTYYWTYGVSSTGTFVKAAGVSWPNGTSGIPNNWNVIEE